MANQVLIARAVLPDSLDPGELRPMEVILGHASGTLRVPFEVQEFETREQGAYLADRLDRHWSWKEFVMDQGPLPDL